MFAVRLFHNRGLGPNFRPSRMWNSSVLQENPAAAPGGLQALPPRYSNGGPGQEGWCADWGHEGHDLHQHHLHACAPWGWCALSAGKTHTTSCPLQKDFGFKVFLQWARGSAEEWYGNLVAKRQGEAKVKKAATTWIPEDGVLRRGPGNRMARCETVLPELSRAWSLPCSLADFSTTLSKPKTDLLAQAKPHQQTPPFKTQTAPPNPTLQNKGSTTQPHCSKPTPLALTILCSSKIGPLKNWYMFEHLIYEICFMFNTNVFKISVFSKSCFCILCNAFDFS